MTTKSGSRIYRRAPKPLTRGACATCGREIKLTPNGRRCNHLDREGNHCTGSGVVVGALAVYLDDLPPVRIPPSATNGGHYCECGWKPKRKANGEFAAHRTEPDNPAAPYCPYGAARSRQ